MHPVVKKLQEAAKKEPTLLVNQDDLGKTYGHDPRYLEDYYGFTKSDLIRLSRLGYAIKAHYTTTNKRHPERTGPYRVRWLLLDAVKEAV